MGIKTCINYYLVCIAFFLLCSTFSNGQSPYSVNLKKDIPLITIMAGGQVGAVYFVRNISPLDATTIGQLSITDVNRFDRNVFFKNSSPAKTISDVFLYSSYAYPFLFLLDKKGRKEAITIGILGLEVFLSNALVTTYTKGLIKRNRPLAYNPDVAFEEKNTTSARLSFYSGHTSGIASLSFFTAQLYSDYFPDSKWKPLVWSAAATLPAITGYLRYQSGKHFPTDVITGYAVGALIGVLIPIVHKKRRSNQKTNLSLSTDSNNLTLILTW